MVFKWNFKQSDLIIAFASGIFLGAAVFDAFPEAVKVLGGTYAALWMAAGLLVWWIQKIVARELQRPEEPVLVATALWFHSILEGVVTGLTFGISQAVGYAVLLGMILHLLPEFFAAAALMKGAGSENRSAVYVAFAGFAILFISFFLTRAYLPAFGLGLPRLIAMSGGAFLYIGGVSFWKRRAKSTLVASMIGILAVWFFI